MSSGKPEEFARASDAGELGSANQKWPGPPQKDHRGALSRVGHQSKELRLGGAGHSHVGEQPGTGSPGAGVPESQKPPEQEAQDSAN